MELRQMGDGVAVHFAEVLRKMPVPGELVRQLAQLATRLERAGDISTGKMMKGSLKLQERKTY